MKSVMVCAVKGLEQQYDVGIFDKFICLIDGGYYFHPGRRDVPINSDILKHIEHTKEAFDGLWVRIDAFFDDI